MSSLSTILLAAGEQFKVEPGEFIFAQGRPADSLYMIIMGSVNIYSVGEDGKTVKDKATLGAGKILAEYAVTRQSTNMYTARAAAPTQLISLKAQKARELVLSTPPFADRVLKALEARGLKTDISEISAAMNQASKKRYNISATEDQARYLAARKINCPVCKKISEHTVTRNSRLVMKSMDNDLRRNYEGIDVIWYSPLVCPHCNYANLISNYDKLTALQAQKLNASEYSAKVPKFYGFSQLRNIDEVMDALYLILDCNEYYKAPPMNNAQVWRRLAWLYMDVDDKEMIERSTDKALELYKNVFETKISSSPGEELSLNISLAALYLMKGDKKLAYQHLALNVKFARENPMAANSHAALCTQSRDMLSDLRETAADLA